MSYTFRTKKMKRHFLCSAIIGIAAVAAQQPGFAQAMPEQIDGYFANSGTVFAKAGGTICGFRSGDIMIFLGEQNLLPISI